MPKPLPPLERVRDLLTYDAETGALRWRVSRGGIAAGSLAGYVGPRGHLRLKLDGRNYSNDRLVWLLYYGEDPGAQEIDHINGDTSDNRIENLRRVERKEICRNMPRRFDNTSGVTGVSWHSLRGKWVAQISANGRHMHLGLYDKFEDAAAARKAAERKYGYHPNHGKGTA